MEQPTFLYHYNTKKLNELYTLEKQWELGISKKPEDESPQKWAFKYDKFPYHKHISFFIDPLPLKLVRKEFTENKVYQQNKKMYEHLVNINVLKDNLLYYMLVESPLDNFMMNHFWDSLFIQDTILSEKIAKWLTYNVTIPSYFKAKNLAKSTIGYQGDNYKDLLKVVDKFHGKTEEAFQALIDSGDLDRYPELRGYYAPMVQHLFIYPKDGIIPIEEIEAKSLT